MVLRGEFVPDSIAETSDEILKYKIVCRETGRHFRIQKSELAFYKQHRLPPPSTFPNKRLSIVYSLRNPMRTAPRRCDSLINGVRCSAEFMSAHPQNSGQKVFCESCFEQAIAGLDEEYY